MDDVVEAVLVKSEPPLHPVRCIALGLEGEAVRCQRSQKNLVESLDNILIDDVSWAREARLRGCHEGRDPVAPEPRSYTVDALDRPLVTVAVRPGSITIMEIARAVERRRDED